MHMAHLFKTNRARIKQECEEEETEDTNIITWSDPSSSDLLTRRIFVLDYQIVPTKAGMKLLQDIRHTLKDRIVNEEERETVWDNLLNEYSRYPHSSVGTFGLFPRTGTRPHTYHSILPL